MNEDHDRGFIALWRSLLGWEWYGDINTCRLFIHLLLTANYENRRVRGGTVKRGQVSTTVRKLAADTSLTPQKVRTALDHLKSTHEITCSANPKGIAITIKNYEKYQTATHSVTSNTRKKINAPTNEQHTRGIDCGATACVDDSMGDNTVGNKRLTNDQQTTSNKNNNIPPISPTGDVFEEYSAGDAALLSALNSFEEMRRKIKKPMTDTAKRRLLRTLDKLAGTPAGKIDLLDEAVLHCWQTVYPPKGGTVRSEYDGAV